VEEKFVLTDALYTKSHMGTRDCRVDGLHPQLESGGSAALCIDAEGPRLEDAIDEEELSGMALSERRPERGVVDLEYVALENLAQRGCVDPGLSRLGQEEGQGARAIELDGKFVWDYRKAEPFEQLPQHPNPQLEFEVARSLVANVGNG
jgi:hypothetical protein